ncbi:MAG TPA: hypothetical protein VGP07_21310 [Polyangia bacterium]
MPSLFRSTAGVTRGARRRLCLVTAAALLGCFAANLLSAASAAPTPAFRLVVHPANPTTAVDRVFVIQAFLKKTHQWPDGQPVRPVDLGEGSAVRQQWSKDYLGRSVEAVKSYWEQLIFSGRDLPPPEFATEEEVITYILRNRGAIGYVSGSASLHGAKVLTLR